MKQVIFILALLCCMPSLEVQSSVDYKWDNASVNELFLKGYSFITSEVNPDSALFYFQLITQRYKDSWPVLMRKYERAKVARSYNNIAFIYMYLKDDYQKALQCVIDAERFCNDDTTRVGLQLTLGSLLSAYAAGMPAEENRQLATYYNRSAFRQAAKLGMTNEMLAAYMNLFVFGLAPEILEENGQETQAMLHRQYENTGLERFTQLFVKGIDCLQHKQMEAALDDFRLQRRLLPLMDDPHLELFMERNMAEVFLNSEHRDSAIYHIKVVQQLSQQFGIGDDEIAADELLSNYYRIAGNHYLADRYALLYHQKRDSLFQSRHLSGLASSGLLEKLNTSSGNSYQLIFILLIGLITTVLLTIFLWRLRHRKNRLKEGQSSVAKPTAVNQESDESTPKYQYSSLSERRKDDIQQHVMETMDNIDIITNPDFSIIMLANICNSNHKYVSQVINERSGKTFSILLAEKRVKEACRRMNNSEEYGNLTLESIGMSVGFKTRSGFLKAFKRVMGVTPSDYVHRKET